MRRRARHNDSARQELTAELGRTPTVREVAERLGCRVEDIESATAMLESKGLSAGGIIVLSVIATIALLAVLAAMQGGH